MFKDDLDLLAEVVTKWGPLPQPVVEVGGLEDPCIADYALTVAAVEKAREQAMIAGTCATYGADLEAAQIVRYLNMHRPLEPWAPGYICEDPGAGGVSIDKLYTKYSQKDGEIGTLICLSTLEHVEDPAVAVRQMNEVLQTGGLCIVSVPFQFPYHPSPEDYWRFTPSALRLLFNTWANWPWEILYCDWRLRIPADAGVLDIHTGKPQAIESAALVARAV